MATNGVDRKLEQEPSGQQQERIDGENAALQAATLSAAEPISSSSPDEKPSNDDIPSSHRGYKYFRPLSEDKRKLPDWLNHFNVKDLKVLFKCSLAVWIYSLFMFIDATLSTLGTATFFGAILLFMVPPSGTVFFVLLAGGTIIMGTCLAWAWGVIVTKAALAARPAADLAQRYRELQELGSRNTTNAEQASGQATFSQVAIFDGFMLDTRVTVTFYCLLCLFIYLMARLKVRAPKLTLMVIFAIIITDINLTIAPLIPTFQGTLPKVLIEPAAIGTGIGVVCNLLVFPTTSVNQVLDSMIATLGPVNEFLSACALKTSKPFHRMDFSRLMVTKSKMIGAYKEMEAPLGFLPIDMHFGKLGGTDVLSLQQPFRQFYVAFMRLLQLQMDREEHATKKDKYQEMVESIQTNPEEASRAGRRHITAIFDLRQRFGTSLSQLPSEETAPDLCRTYVDMLDTCQQTVDISLRILTECNGNAWFGKASKAKTEEQRASDVEVLEQLRQRNERFAAETANYLQAHYAELRRQEASVFDGNNTAALPPIHGLVTSLILEESMLNLSHALETLSSRLIDLHRDRSKNCLWFPSKIQKLFSWAVEKDDASINSEETKVEDYEAPQSTVGEDKQVTEKDAQVTSTTETRSAAKQLAKMNRSGGRHRNVGGKAALGVIHWFTNEEGIFALRMLVITIGLGVLAVNRTTAGFFYRQKGLWALIMAQTGLALYMADFVYSTLLRVAGTIFGAVLGLIAWYIGAGNGPGNPYGMAAILVPMILIVMYLRLFTPPAALGGVVISGATLFLIVGYSWDDTHIPSYGNPGVGYAVFWRRLLLVLVGIAAATIVTVLPYPPSANLHQRKVLADILIATKNNYALFVQNCREPAADLDKVAERRAIEFSELLHALQPQISMSKLEFSTSRIDAASLGRVCHLTMALNRAVSQMLLVVPKLPADMKERFIHLSGCLDERVVAEAMSTLTLLEQTLRLDRPLPMVLPILQDTACRIWATRRDTNFSDQVSAKMLAEEGARKYCLSMAALVQMLSSVDDMVVVVKRAVGETSSIDVELL